MEISKALLFKITLSPFFWSSDRPNPYHIHREVTHPNTQFPLPSMRGLISDTDGSLVELQFYISLACVWRFHGHLFTLTVLTSEALFY